MPSISKENRQKALVRKLVGLRESATPDYQAASMGRRFSGWYTSGAGVNQTVLSSALTLRDRCRDAVRNNPVANRAVRSFVANAIGTGIKPQSLHPDPEVRRRIHKAWRRWVDSADSTGNCDFYGLQTLALTSMLESGEVFLRLRPRRMGDLEVPLQIQAIEADNCPLDLTVTRDQNQIRMGIEFSPIDRIVAYHMYRYHPADVLLTGQMNTLPIPVPAQSVAHMFEPMRPGQVRGLPRLAPVLARLFDLEQYNDAEVVRKKVASLVAGFVLKSDLAASVAGEGSLVDGIKPAAWEPGQLIELLPGEDVKFSEPTDVGDNYEKFEKSQLRRIAAAVGLTYEQLTGDLSDVNYSSIRAGLVEFRRQMEAFQHQVVVHRLCRPIWRAWLEQAALAGVIDANDFEANYWDYLDVKWIPQGWQWVDPEKEINAALKGIRAGLTTRTEVIASTGYDPEEIDAEWAADRDRAEALGNVYETDPAKDADRISAGRATNEGN